MAEKIKNDKKSISKQSELKFGKKSNEEMQIAADSSVLGTYGDILVAYNASSWGIDFGYPGHAGIVSNTSGKTVESFPEDGVQYHTNDWGSRENVYAMYVKGATTTKYKGAATYAANQIGKDYNWNFVNPWTEDSFYCSQLVWKAWKSQGIDVDYITIDPIVTPMEIAKSKNTIIYYSN
ncbi:YiiX/YebB-like N1pC/P60 family cysteine hydrolase [Calidifontibacillus erzurumensis]